MKTDRTTRGYLDALKTKLGVTSDYGLAKRLGVSRQRVSNWRAGRSSPDWNMVTKISEILDVPGGPIAVHMDFDVERRPERVAFWRKMIAAAKKAPLTIMLVAGAALGLSPQPADAARFTNNRIVERSPLVADATEIHIASHRRRRQRGAILARLAAWLSACCALSFSL